MPLTYVQTFAPSELPYHITKTLHREDQGSYQDGDQKHQGQGRQYQPPLQSRPL